MHPNSTLAVRASLQSQVTVILKAIRKPKLRKDLHEQINQGWCGFFLKSNRVPAGGEKDSGYPLILIDICRLSMDIHVHSGLSMNIHELFMIIRRLSMDDQREPMHDPWESINHPWISIRDSWAIHGYPSIICGYLCITWIALRIDMHGDPWISNVISTDIRGYEWISFYI